MKNEKQPHDNYCGATKKQSQGTCMRPSGWGTDHPGVGRCKLHGGKSTGPPPGNKNAVTTGEHEAIWMDALDKKERVLFDSIRTDPLEQINNGIKLLEIRERRMLLRIQEVRNGAEGSSKDRKFELLEGLDGRMRMKETERTQKDRSKLERILAIEDALTRVQDKKTKLLELKHKFLVDEVPDEDDSDDGFIAALEGKVNEVWDEEDNQ